MIAPLLQIGLHRRASMPSQGAHAIHEVTGGPAELLDWLEVHLGVNGPQVTHSERVVDYVRRLKAAPGDSFRASMEQDEWATATELLGRRDELLLEGWKPDQSDGLQAIVQDLARCEQDDTVFRPGVPDRLRFVLDALDAGIRVPEHVVVVDEPAAEWPVLWQEVLLRLNVEEAAQPQPTAPEGSLRDLQKGLVSRSIQTLRIDPSLNVLRTRSRHAAIQTLLAWLPQMEPTRTVVVCEDDHVAGLLDAALAANGHPTTGVTVQAHGQPAHQVLPLVLQLCWEPVNPYALLDLMLLPVGPVPRRAGFRLAEALAEEPGFGSEEWQRAWEHVTDKNHDPEGKTRKRLEEWLLHERVRQGQSIPTALVRERCGLVAQWATKHANLLDEQDPMAASYHAAAAQATALADLASTFGDSIPEAQVQRLLDDVLDERSVMQSHEAQAGGLRTVRSLADVPDGTEDVVWLGTTTQPAGQCSWTLGEQRALQEAGLRVGDVQAEATARQRAEIRGLCHAKRLLVVQYPADEAVTHPIWLQAAACLGDFKAPFVEDLLAGRCEAPWAPLSREAEPASVPVARPSWRVPVVPQVTGDSATSLEARLACPVKWFLHHAVGIRSSPVADIPHSFRLRGTLAHKVLEHVLEPGELPSREEALRRLEACFEDIVARDAAPLAQPRKLREKQQLYGELRRTLEVLVETLARGGYRVVGMEQGFDDELDGRRTRGFIDCIVANDDGEAILDFKYGGIRKYPGKLEEGRAVQLATYAAARSQAGHVHGVGYVVLDGPRIASPTGSPLQGVPDGVLVQGDDVHATWQAFTQALRETDARIASGMLDAWPRHDRDQRPRGVDLVVEDVKKGEDPEACKYCDHGLLCGRSVAP